jgi:hypothetical protein
MDALSYAKKLVLILSSSEPGKTNTYPSFPLGSVIINKPYMTKMKQGDLEDKSSVIHSTLVETGGSKQIHVL